MLGIFLGIIAIIYFLTQINLTNYGLDAGLTADLIAVFPGLFVTILGLLAVGFDRGNGLIVGGFAVAGIGMAILWGEMYTAAIIDDVVLAGMSLAQLQAITIIVSALIGGAAYASQR